MFVYDIIGYIAIIFHLLAFLANSKNSMRLNGMISSAFFSISIFFYNGINGFFVSIISFITKLLSFFIHEDKLNILKYSSPIIAFFFFYFINEEGIIGILPAVSLIFIIIADLQKDIIKMKYIYYGSVFCWLLYGIFLNSIPAVLFDLFGFFTLTYSIYKLKKERELNT